MVLKRNKIKEVLVSSEIQCALYCLRLSDCHSINIGKKKVQEYKEEAAKVHALLICQLNRATADSDPEYLVHKNGFHYYSFISTQFGD